MERIEQDLLLFLFVPFHGYILMRARLVVVRRAAGLGLLHSNALPREEFFPQGRIYFLVVKEMIVVIG